MGLGKKMLGKRHVLPGVSTTLHEVQVEGTFPDGTKLVTGARVFPPLNAPFAYHKG